MNQVAETIMQQIGGRMAMPMIGGYAVAAESDALSFRFKAKALESLNFCKVTLTPMDTYTVELGRWRAGEYKKIHEFENIYCEELQETIERSTGLLLSFRKVRFVGS